MLKRLLLTLLLSLSFLIVQPVQAQDKVFTLEELSQYDGRDGRSAYFAYEGLVYDVTGSPTWKLGNHFGLQAGQDLTGQMEGAPHGVEVFVGLKEVGRLEGAAAVEAVSENTAETPTMESSSAKTMSSERVWYEGRLEIFGMSILGWTGIFLGIFFVLTFATCFAMPWAKLPLPWKGKRPGPDDLDSAPNHMGWSSIHKHFVWWTVIFGLIHGVLGFLQLMGIYL